MPGKSSCCDDVSRDVHEEQIDCCLNLLRRESLREKVQRDNESRVRIPVGEMKSNFVGMENLLVGSARTAECRRDCARNFRRERVALQHARSISSQLGEDDVN